MIRDEATRLLDGSASESRSAALVIDAILSNVEQLPEIDREMRAWWHGWQRYRITFRPANVDGALLRLLSFHASGYEREHAVALLAKIEDGSELPYLLLRLNDWVPEVRDAASDAVLARITASYAPHFARNVTLLDRLRDAKRADHLPLLEQIAELLRVHARPELLAALQRRKTARAAFRLLNDEDAVREGVRSEDFIVRIWSIQRGTLPDDVIRELLDDSFAAVRRESLRVAIRRFPGTDLLRRALLDRSASIRDEARFHLRSRSDEDPAAIYRDALAHNPLVAIAGLGETGNVSDADRLAGYLSHSSSRIRRATIRAIARLQGEAAIPMLLEMILDPSSAVSAQARNSLARQGAMLDGAQLSAMHPTSDHAKRNLVLLMASLSKWDSILALLDADRELATPFIERWFAAYNRSQSVPSRAQLERLTLASNDARFPFAAELRFAISAFQK